MKVVLITVTFIWCGLVLGISFVATPLKFMAPNITLELGLGIGQLVFDALIKIEGLLAILVGVSVSKIKPQTGHYILFCVPIVILGIQGWILLPYLDERLELILSGNPPPESYHHMTYIVLEITKVVSLFVGGILFTKDQL